MDAALKQRLEKNIQKYSWYKVFTKRVYLPLITIQLVTVGKVTLEELALIVIISSIVQGVLQMPAGYIADKIGNRKSIILGASISVVSPLLYAFMPNFWGGLIASVLFFGGYAFQSGAIESFIHNTLIALNREKEYAKVMGRAQTFGLIANVVLVALVPLTYQINHTLPFIIGFFSLVAMLWLAVSFVHPNASDGPGTPKNPFLALKSIVNAQNIILFIFAGLLTGVSNKGGEFRELLFQHIGIPISLFGFIVALASIVGAVMGWYVHILDKLKPLAFYLFDLIVITGCLLLIGATSNPALAIIAFTVFAAYSRIRLIIFQAKMLHEIKHAYKATLISALNLFTLLGDVLAISLLTKFVTENSYINGYLLFGFSILGIGAVLWLGMVGETKSRYKKEARKVSLARIK